MHAGSKGKVKSVLIQAQAGDMGAVQLNCSWLPTPRPGQAAIELQLAGKGPAGQAMGAGTFPAGCDFLTSQSGGTGNSWPGSGAEAMLRQLRAGALAAGLATQDLLIVPMASWAVSEARAGSEPGSCPPQGLICLHPQLPLRPLSVTAWHSASCSHTRSCPLPRAGGAVLPLLPPAAANTAAPTPAILLWVAGQEASTWQLLPSTWNSGSSSRPPSMRSTCLA